MRGSLLRRAVAGLSVVGVCAVAAAPATAAPDNDDFAAATRIVALPFADAYDTTDATFEAGEPSTCSPSPPGSPPLRTVWYRYFAPHPITLSLDVSAPEGAAVLGIYGGTVFNPGVFACPYDSPPNHSGPVQMPLAAGDTISLQALEFDTTQGRVTVEEVATQTTRAPTTTSVAVTPSPSAGGQDITLEATVAYVAAGSEKPAGTVQFRADGVDLGGPVALDADAKATGHTSSLSVGAHTITGVFDPVADDVEPSAGQIGHDVDRRPTSTAVSVTPDPTVAGQRATFTAVITGTPPGLPSGSVQFRESDGTPIGAPQPVSDARATLLATAGAAHYTVRADYSGDPTFAPSSGEVGQTVDKADTETHVSSSANPVAPGATVVFTVDVTVKPPGDVPVYGSLLVSINGVPAADPIPLDGFDAIQISATAPATARSDTIAFSYSGDEDTNPSAASLVQVVSAPASGTAPVSPPPPAPLSPDIATRLRAMTAALATQLRSGGLRALGRTRQPLEIDRAGVVSQKVSGPAPSSRTAAAHAKTRKVVLATATRRFSGAGHGTLRLRLTKPGRAAIRRAKKLELSVVTRFVPSQGRAVTIVDRMTVTRARRRAAPAEVTVRQGIELGRPSLLRVEIPVAGGIRVGGAAVPR